MLQQYTLSRNGTPLMTGTYRAIATVLKNGRNIETVFEAMKNGYKITAENRG